MLKQARSRFNMIRRMLSAHPSDVLSPKEQINLGQYGKINKVCHECVCQLEQQRFHGTTAHTRGCPIILQVQTGLRELRRLSVNTASDIMTKLQRIDTRTTMRKLDATLAQHSRHIASHEATPFAAKLSSSSLRQHGGACRSSMRTFSDPPQRPQRWRRHFVSCERLTQQQTGLTAVLLDLPRLQK